jgi:apolipoprotein D and lipocalin family protein
MSLPPPRTVSGFALPRYLGTWYELARLPIRFEPADCSDVSAQYALRDDGGIEVRNRCLRADGTLEESIGVATAVDADNGQLEVSFLPAGLRWIPFTKGDYWVLRVDPDYRVALVGSPDRTYLWLLARSTALDPQLRAAYLATAREQGYALDRLIDTPHTGRPTATPTD